MARPQFRGAIPALVTPFKNGALDEAAFRVLVERQIVGGVGGLVPVGTTGETATLSHQEHRRVVELCVEVAAGRAPVIAGAGSNSTDEAISLVRHAKDVGAQAALVVTPYYNRPSQEGLYRHYAAINDAVELPLLIYNVPARTSVDISNDTIERLAKLPNIAGVKDATSDLSRPSVMRLTCGEDFVLLSGEDGTALGYMAHGGHGCISVTANVAPEAMSRLINANIPEYGPANRFNHEPRRPRKLLLHRRQIDRLLGAVQREGRTLVPLRLYFNDKGRVKLELALATGKKAHDKRATVAERDWKREQGRLMRDRG